jgi:hypothetical protein
VRKLMLTIAVLAALGGGVAETAHAGKVQEKAVPVKIHVHLFIHKTTWIEKWQKFDESIYPANHVAAGIFNVSESLLNRIVGDEGGNINPRTLHSSLCTGSQPGWNLLGSSAFGPYQFMLDYKAPCDRESDGWGTFGSYDDAAFHEAKVLGFAVPYRFKSPASNVGQAITAAYMIAHGGSVIGVHHNARRFHE